MSERRVPEAASLRALFQEQWDFLLQLIEDWRRVRCQERQQQRTLNAAVESIVTGTDARLRGLMSYQRQLRQSARELLLYIEDIVSRMPAPVLVTKQSLVMDPALGRLFLDMDLVDRLLQEKPSHRDFLARQPASQLDVYALFSLFRVEKQTFGVQLQGEMLVSDVLQTLVSFVGHEVIALESAETALRSTLKRTLFDSVVAHARAAMARLRHAQTRADGHSNASDGAGNLNDPAVYLKTLEALLASPRELLVLENSQLTINRMGVKVSSVTPDTTTSADTFDLHEISVGDSRPRLLCMTRHPGKGSPFPPPARPSW